LSHSGKSFPAIVGGGRKLGFKHGQHLKWPTDKKPMSDRYLTILQQLGSPVKSFKESTGPITELLAEVASPSSIPLDSTKLRVEVCGGRAGSLEDPTEPGWLDDPTEVMAHRLHNPPRLSPGGEGHSIT
jgi:hypothetical protein